MRKKCKACSKRKEKQKEFNVLLHLIVYVLMLFSGGLLIWVGGYFAKPIAFHAKATGLLFPDWSLVLGLIFASGLYMIMTSWSYFLDLWNES